MRMLDHSPKCPPEPACVMDKRVRRLRANFIHLSLFGTFAICGLLACSRSPSQADLESHFREGGGPDWLFVSGGHINFDANTASLIREWLIAHDADWKAASLRDLDPAKSQLLTDNCAIEIDGDRIVVSYETDKKDTDSTIYVQRLLSPRERSFWNTVIEQIKTQTLGKLSRK
jgi:hypothetical protein